MARYSLLAAIMMAWLSPGLLAAQFPYAAQIATPTAQLRSGPGTQFYATGQLLQDEEVEVYRHVGTWCAVRPTPSSFSYLRADQVRITEVPDVLEVTVAGARTRVGSEISEDYKVQYVTLHRGERVRMVGEPVMFGNPPRRWYKIAPPAGEFRWIARAELVPLHAADDNSELEEPTGEIEPVPSSYSPNEDSSEADGLEPEAMPLASQPEPTPASGLALPQSSAETLVQPKAATTDDDRIPLQKLGQRGESMSTEPIPQDTARPSSRDGFAASTAALTDATPLDSAQPLNDEELEQLPSIMVRGSGAVRRVAGSDDPAQIQPADGSLASSTTDLNAAWTAVDTSQPTPPSPESVDRSLGQLASLELELSRVVTQDIGRWQLEPLQSRLIELRRAGGDQNFQQSIEHLWKRTQEFVELQRRHQALLGASPSAIRAADSDSLLAGEGVGEGVALTGATDSSHRAATGSVPGTSRPGAPNEAASVPAHGAARTSRRAPAATPAIPPSTQYAGQGWLVPVLTSRSDLPRFALTDAQGQILHFVTPVPGLNLRRYLRQQVGIVGSSRAGRTGEPGPLLAERVIVLDRR